MTDLLDGAREIGVHPGEVTHRLLEIGRVEDRLKHATRIARQWKAL